MEKQQALTLLGLNEQYSAADLTSAVVAKKQLLQQKRDAAPTELLKAKFEMMLLQLNEAETLLQAASSVSSHAKASSPLSQTKLADLPSMAAGDAEQLALQQGQVLAGRYEIKELLGQGGMGAVYRAFDKNRGQDIAIKLLLPSLTKNERARERFLNEARLSSSLSHPNIVNVFDVQNDGDLYFLTMELLEGQDLRQVMDNQKLVGRPFDIEDIKHYLAAVCEGLAEAHKLTVHRDIKPENIWIGSDGSIKLMDFGIAQAQSTSQRTKTGAAMGTAYYMAPEQLKGLSDIDGRADQYAVAVLAYELLTSEVPAGAIEPVGDLRKDTPKAMAAAIMQALSPRAENRFASITDFNSALQSGKTPKASKTKSTSYSSSHTSAKWPMVAGVIAVLVVGGGLLSTGIVDVNKLLPVSKEIIAAQKAQVAKAQGEIKVYKQRLENGRRQLDSDVRDAERNKSADLARLKHWQDLTENAIFAGNQITELEGELSMAETLLRENAFEAAQSSMDKVSTGYKSLWDNFTAAEKAYEATLALQQAKTNWQQAAKSGGYGATAEAKTAQTAEDEARQAQLNGDIFVSLARSSVAVDSYQKAHLEITQVEKQREQLGKIKNQWKALQSSYGLKDDVAAESAAQADKKAISHAKAGELSEAEKNYQIASEQWRQAMTNAKPTLLRMDSDRTKAEIKRRDDEAWAAAVQANSSAAIRGYLNSQFTIHKSEAEKSLKYMVQVEKNEALSLLAKIIPSDDNFAKDADCGSERCSITHGYYGLKSDFKFSDVNELICSFTLYTLTEKVRHNRFRAGGPADYSLYSLELVENVVEIPRGIELKLYSNVKSSESIERNQNIYLVEGVLVRTTTAFFPLQKDRRYELSDSVIPKYVEAFNGAGFQGQVNKVDKMYKSKLYIGDKGKNLDQFIHICSGEKLNRNGH